MMLFKVGICGDPQSRLQLYHTEKVWLAMDLAFQAPAEMCRRLEIELIKALKSTPGCYNIKPGGEGVSTGADYKRFVYFVIAPCGEGISLREAHRRRSMENYTHFRLR